MTQMSANLNIATILSKLGPSLSSTVTRFLVSQGISPDAARKRIQRARGDVCRLRYIKFPHNETFLYLRDHWRTEKFFTSLREALHTSGSAYGYAIDSIVAREGVV